MGGLPLFHHGFQLLVRSSDYNTGYAKAQALATALAAVDDATVEVGADFVSYLLHSVTQTTGVVAQGQGENQRRWLFTVGFLVTILMRTGGRLIPFRFNRQEAFPTSLLEGRVVRQPVPVEELLNLFLPFRFNRQQAFPPSLLEGHSDRRPIPHPVPPAGYQYTGSGLLDDGTTPVTLVFTVRVGIVNEGGSGFGLYTTPPVLTEMIGAVDGATVFDYTIEETISDEVYVVPTDTVLMYFSNGAPTGGVELEFTGGDFPDVDGDLPDDISIAACSWGDIDLVLWRDDGDLRYERKLTSFAKTGTGGP